MNIKTENGFTIIEVLVAMVILSIGVLGLGLMQLMSLQNTQGGQMRSRASIMAYDIIDSMRANTPAVNGGNYDIDFGDATPANVNCYGIEADCSSDQMATADLNHWRTAVGNGLPAGDGQVTTTDLGGTTQVSVAISWIDPYSADDGNEQVSLTSELRQ